MAQALQLGSPVAKRHKHGFTLIELMIVVVIVGILATLAVVGYRKLVQSSHVSEATGMVQSIRVAQESYHSETQQYASISNSAAIPPGNGTSVTSGLYPATPTYGIMTAWGATCTVCASGMDWSMLPVHVDGPVLFGYATVAGPANQAPVPAQVLANGSAVVFPSAPTIDWFVIGAEADLDNDPTNFTDVFTTSWSNQVWVSNEGQ
jgi:type IV pilus assembly protein PilA